MPRTALAACGSETADMKGEATLNRIDVASEASTGSPHEEVLAREALSCLRSAQRLQVPFPFPCDLLCQLRPALVEEGREAWGGVHVVQRQGLA